MRSVRRLAALLLLVLWLPATLHCDLEAAGVAGMVGCHPHDASGFAHSEDDLCHSIEGVSYKPEFAVIKTPPPVATLLFVFAHSSLLAAYPPPREVAVEAGAAPPEVARTWHFAARAAPPARAPAFEA